MSAQKGPAGIDPQGAISNYILDKTMKQEYHSTSDILLYIMAIIISKYVNDHK